ncbi:hypothetical protein QQS21_007342 [Conoideocrella luteorostrata]|uniref:Uncharacterized protein n=1 Tax=Conoideocrella luteorostrata TaxID=1105319 RepID=A0AAJ0CL13_9HYPO|nr:hypothetical protein QQS21_007342 [Conoideocrella luteorostrata]
MTTIASSPVKQRAALAPLDANAKPSLPSPKMPKDGSISAIPLTGGSSPLKRVLPASLVGTKRPAEDASSPGNKKPCVDEESTRLQRSRTSSPSTSSIFDTSAAEGDSSWATAATEPDTLSTIITDAPALLAPRQRGNMTREQAREKAEILRLRLGLASYKLRTGQTTVPLADLQHKPLPPPPRRTIVRVQSPSENDNVQDAQQTPGNLNTSSGSVEGRC